MLVQPRRTSAAIAAAGALALAACAPRVHAPANAPGGQGHGGIVLSASQIGTNGANLLAAMQGHVAGMGVRHPLGVSCPEITLRGPKSLMGSNDPLVYVDGTRATNTCVLEMLSPSDVEHVEVYPAGVSSRAGYDVSGNGVILVFMLTGA